VAGAQEAVRTEAKVGFLLQKKADTEDPGFDDLHRVGTAASIVRYLTAPDGTHHLVCQGERRFRVLDQVSGFPFLVARVEFLPETGATNPDVEARALYLKQKAVEAISLLPQAPAELANSIQAIESPSMLADMIASFLDIKATDKQELLETTELRDRLERVSALLTRRVEVLKLSRQIEEQTKEALDDRQKEILLREQMRQIRKELGEDGQGLEEIAELSEAITKAGMPPDIDEHARKELKRLERMSEASGEYSMARTYLDTLLGLPWSKLDVEDIDIERARGILDADTMASASEAVVEYRGASTRRAAAPSWLGPPPGAARPARSEHRARARDQVPARESRRHARRGRNPRSPPHLHRRAARQHPAGDPQGGHPQPGADARRDRQAGRGYPGRPRLGAARGARPRAEFELPRQLPGRAVRSLEGTLHRDRERA
jgi:ATP-dependent Lon protease